MPYVRSGGRLSGFWDDLYKGAAAVAGIAQTVQQGAVAGKQVAAGNAQVAVVPTRQGLANYATDHASNVVPYVLAGGAVLAVLLATKGGRRRR